MILVLLIISIIILVIGIIMYYEFDKHRCSEFLEILSAIIASVGGICTLMSAMFTIGLIVDVSVSSTLPSKIQILEDTNTQMEKDINIAIQKYCEYENKTYVELKQNELTLAFEIYPDLKTNELVTSYINVIIDNRNEIKNLKLKYASSHIQKWWLYFGN